jgi:DNA adenine methylase
MKAPFPCFGGKGLIAPAVWQRFGQPNGYVEPFAGSLAVLLARPKVGRYDSEIANDKNGLLVNFWRATKIAPDAVAAYADSPVFESDLHARRDWIRATEENLTEQLIADPDFYDAKIAGWWAWGVSCSIGNTWLRDKSRGMPSTTSRNGVCKYTPAELSAYFQQLATRLRRVVLLCGDWHRTASQALTLSRDGLGCKENPKGRTVAVFLDPPYSAKRDATLYGGNDDMAIAHDVREWAIANGDNPLLRIALCGYEGEHDMPANWSTFEWRANGGFGNQRKHGTNGNRHKECIWFSPHCLKCSQLKLLEVV